jgi:hypothetical protein
LPGTMHPWPWPPPGKQRTYGAPGVRCIPELAMWSFSPGHARCEGGNVPLRESHLRDNVVGRHISQTECSREQFYAQTSHPSYSRRRLSHRTRHADEQIVCCSTRKHTHTAAARRSRRQRRSSAVTHDSLCVGIVANAGIFCGLPALERVNLTISVRIGRVLELYTMPNLT